MDFQWPEHFDRIPSDPWTEEGIESLALNYDTVENHGWYANLDQTVEQVGEYVRKVLWGYRNPGEAPARSAGIQGSRDRHRRLVAEIPAPGAGEV